MFFVLVLLAALLRADDIGDLQSKADAWIAKSKEIYRLDCDDMKQIWTAYCSEYTVSEEPDREAARDVDRIKDSVHGEIEPQLSPYEDLKSRWKH